MAPKKISNRLSALDVTRLGAGKHLDGAGLYLQVDVNGGRSWIYRFTSPTQADKKDPSKPQVRYMGLGSTDAFSLSRARELATEARGQVKSGIDPIEQRKASRAAARLEASKALTFETAVENYIEAHRNSWRTKKHEVQMRSMMKNYAYPIIGRLPVTAIEDEHVRLILNPIWHTKIETSRRVRGHVESVLERETHLKHRMGDNPARLGMVKTALGKQAYAVRHMPALPYTEIGAFMEALKAQDGIGALALQFTILTAARTGETIGAKLDEFDLANEVWTIPAARMKTQKEHREPLSPAALEIINVMVEMPGSEYLFPGGKKGRPLSNMAMLMTLERMGRRDITVHGFRSTFRDWASEQTSFAREVAEAALAHKIPDAVEAAYRRGDLFDKRCRLMNDWAQYCGTTKRAGKVIPIRQRK